VDKRMKIIKPGILPPLKEVEFRCPECKCIFVANQHEYEATTTYSNYRYEDPVAHEYCCVCPTCGSKVFALEWK
jgi:hypothetical protein